MTTPISPKAARALHDAGVPGVPPFVALAGRPVLSKQLFPPPLTTDWRRIPLTKCPECPKLMPAHQERCNAHV
ncbi:hypothetical protein HYQ19_gp063 [Arthrobacter phage DrYang]|uniref:Uncharacterized protein n=1 Tax=Arthrobacter phage DrYang TaxID=2686080 RepID=A0A6B9JE99_9CAUD|nr:hypothetical protein HYQ19_gp063 [Arthrobacter phage DrYang]QGZ17162.1 hypothetical protein SEA_DRYANG_63 [Arthrobacter phage DrYang]